MDVAFLLIIVFILGVFLGLMRDDGKDDKLERVAYEMGRLINALRMEKGLNPWTKYEMKRCEEVFKEKNKTMTKKIYIAGKITGEPIRKCIAKFNNAEIALYHKYRASNKRVFIPLHLPGIHFGIPHAEAMKICLGALKECTHIYMLEDWKDSKGATMEHDWAKENGLEIIYEE